MSTKSVDAAIQARDRGTPLIDYLRSRGYVQDISDERGWPRHSPPVPSPPMSVSIPRRHRFTSGTC